MLAARSGNVAAVQALLAKGADVNAREKTRQQTALMWAVVQQAPGGDAAVGREGRRCQRAIGQPDAGLQHGREPVGGQRIGRHAHSRR